MDFGEDTEKRNWKDTYHIDYLQLVLERDLHRMWNHNNNIMIEQQRQCAYIDDYFWTTQHLEDIEIRQLAKSTENYINRG